MNIVIVYPIFYLLLFLLTRNKKQHVSYGILLLFYFVASSTSYYLTMVSSHHGAVEHRVVAVAYHICCTWMLLSPIKRYDVFASSKMYNGDRFILNTFTIVVVCLSLLSIVSDIGNINIQAIFGDAGDLRHKLLETQQSSLLGYLTFWGSCFSTAALALFFYFCIYYPHRKALIVILLFCSLSTIVSGMTVAAREYLIKYVFLLVIGFIICRKHLNPYWNKRLRMLTLIIGLLAIGMFIIISISRFEVSRSFDYANSSSSTVNSLFSYLGQGHVNYSLVFDRYFDTPDTPGAINFPFFASTSISKYDLSNTLASDIDLNSFPTALGSMLIDCGGIITFFIILVYSLLFRWIGRLRFNVFTLIYVFWVYEFMFSYVFFLNEVYNTSRIISLLFVIFFDLMYRRTQHKTHNTYMR